VAEIYAQNERQTNRETLAKSPVKPSAILANHLSEVVNK